MTISDLDPEYRYIDDDLDIWEYRHGAWGARAPGMPWRVWHQRFGYIEQWGPFTPIDNNGHVDGFKGVWLD